MDRTREYHTKRSKSERERQVPYDVTYMWNLKYDISERETENRNGLTDRENRPVAAKGQGLREARTGRSGRHRQRGRRQGPPGTLHCRRALCCWNHWGGSHTAQSSIASTLRKARTEKNTGEDAWATESLRCTAL